MRGLPYQATAGDIINVRIYFILDTTWHFDLDFTEHYVAGI